MESQKVIDHLLLHIGREMNMAMHTLGVERSIFKIAIFFVERGASYDSIDEVTVNLLVTGIEQFFGIDSYSCLIIIPLSTTFASVIA
ncbi:unnamed protein product [Rodentolepis nana]|uniref:ThrE domain-containing protein n=1 Tax=Rodentolepis nana TaxID=102285 RepID=A0A0R3T0F6_RODNA|nr:unnamed protein product [Rodentolepis nana]